ncbi:MAG: ribosomal protein S18-alanine N-acetyltransferase [Sterolibacteriaceae bacterium MAG5]|nr:ribosomal protein S18-alanine N-acetyltransferase [Candidatus Nitricoxidireducens bremensis]
MNAVLVPRLDFMPMAAADVPAIMETENRIYPFPWSAGNFADSLASGHSAWVCREAGAMVGYAVMMLVLDEAHLLNISVAAERQRGGLGSRLLEFLFEEAKAHGAARMFLEVRPSNASGLGLYRRFGFAEIGRRRGYYPAHDGREDAIVMARDL